MSSKKKKLFADKIEVPENIINKNKIKLKLNLNKLDKSKSINNNNHIQQPNYKSITLKRFARTP